MAFGDNALEFELRCIVTNVESGSSVKSDLHFAIIKRFRQAGITIPYPKPDVCRAESLSQAEPPLVIKPASRGAA